ncbi:hypothetical protein NM688_g2853 [Phlebia brevispora]|uniref:Uncharacterized protein n=1 Tax=Phlebia brevispora TaxID=194682 RepID=A0ACC1T7G3_9APHY|nr:hypothetical protein NM688_g2853 [Phlebia brevispora]
MSKHRLSPDNLPPQKRLHTTSSSFSHTPSHPQATNLATLYDEIVLVIFSFLSYRDLCAIQRTNHNWSRLALDNQLWKKLYLSEYGRARLRGVRGFVGRTDGREVKPLPSRAKAEDTDDTRDWKWMFRISTNWRIGRCTTESVLPKLERPSVPLETGHENHGRQILLAGSLLVATTQDETGSPALSLISPTGNRHTISCRTTRSNGSTQVSALALDQSPPANPHHVRLAAFLTTGEFIVFSINHIHPSQSSRLSEYQPITRAPRTAPILQAVYHDRLLVTLSRSFHLSIYDLSSGSIAHTQTLSSFTSYPPSSMVLTPTSTTTYKLVLAYAIPVFPAHWSVGATELILSNETSMVVTSSRTARAVDIPSGWIDEQKMRAVREQWSRKVEKVADTQTDGKWVVLAPSELPSLPSNATIQDGSSGDANEAAKSYKSSSLHSPCVLQLYRLYFPASTSGASTSKLTFVRTLHGQVGPVSALSLADGRCVSLGVNGSIWVWDLEAASGTEVSAGRGMTDGVHGVHDIPASSVVFDERKIISADSHGVELRRFDI